ncbi:MAG: OmpH family outer membrane protein [Bacteroidota bacterium]|nr:OmpH family outer membrane protein [Bacteroidota bacterium]
MKQIKNVFIALVLFVGVYQFANAQKVAHINVQALMESYPEYTKANKQLETTAETFEKDYKGLVTEFTSKRDKYIAEEGNVSDAINQERAVELQNMEKSIRDFAAEAQKKLDEKKVELHKPIMEKVQAAIDKVAKAKGYEYVFDSTLGASNILVANGPDMIADVKKELGIK